MIHQFHLVKSCKVFGFQLICYPADLFGAIFKNFLRTTKLRVHKYIQKVKQSSNRPGVAQRVLGYLDSHISMTFGT